MKPLVIVPVWNEAPYIASVIDDLGAHGFLDIVVVDDGSSDNTRELLGRFESVHIFRHAVNRGTGAAIQTGLDWGLSRDFSHFLTIDGDGQQYARDVQKVFESLQENDFVIGSRFLSPNTIPLFRYIANKVANIITGLLFGVWVSDSQSGVRGFSREVAQRLHLQADGFEFCSAFLREVAYAGFEVVEVSISVVYPEALRKKGQNFAQGLQTLGRLCVRALSR